MRVALFLREGGLKTPCKVAFLAEIYSYQDTMLAPYYEKMVDTLDGAGISYITADFAGAHEMSVWNQQLVKLVKDVLWK